MPEGDTVWRTAHHLDAAFAGTELTVTDFRVPAFATVDLRGERVEDVVSRGKHLLLRTPGYVVHSHLKMEGSWHLYRLPRPRWRRPAHTARAVLENGRWQAVGFSLGVLEVLPRGREQEAVGHLGPDLLDEDFDIDTAVGHLESDPARPVFLALLDQRNLAGLGNEYVNELLFMRRIAPTRPAGEVEDLSGFVALARRVLGANARRVERSFTGSTRDGEERWVYRRGGLRCRRCGTPIAESQYGDDPTRERICFWCPSCQAQ